jgi:hypothetical protein
MALADGFNPCAMWLLIYLISLIAGLREREKIWWLVGTFVLRYGLSGLAQVLALGVPFAANLDHSHHIAAARTALPNICNQLNNCAPR